MANLLLRLTHRLRRVAHGVSHYLGWLNHLADQEARYPVAYCAFIVIVKGPLPSETTPVRTYWKPMNLPDESILNRNVESSPSIRKGSAAVAESIELT